jgi:hypothetical protein
MDALGKRVAAEQAIIEAFGQALDHGYLQAKAKIGDLAGQRPRDFEQESGSPREVGDYAGERGAGPRRAQGFDA